MARKKAKKQKATESKAVDVYERWLAKRPVRRVKGKSGFVSAA